MTEARIDAETLDGLRAVERTVTERIRSEAAAHELLDADALSVETMYVVGSIGAGEGRRGSDLDLVVVLTYNGEASGDYGWLEYVQRDIETALGRSRGALAGPLDGVGYVDPTLADRIEATAAVRDMATHGGYDRVYDLGAGAPMDAGRF